MKPILFNGPMVRAILAGRKTQTRRVIKPQPAHMANGDETEPLMWGKEGDKVGYAWAAESFGKPHPDWLDGCPYGQPGDRLWVLHRRMRPRVRETWSPDHSAFYPHYRIVYRADSGLDYLDEREDGCVFSPETNDWCPFRWRPSIHMPRWASRITLEITDVRVERLQDISEADIEAEGVELSTSPISGTMGTADLDVGTVYSKPRAVFRHIWDSIAKPGAKWADNPWCWTISFGIAPPS